MRHEDGRVFGDAGGFRRSRSCQRQVRRQRQYPAQHLLMAQAGIQCDRPALRETGEEDVLRGDTALPFLCDQILDVCLCGNDAGRVFILADAG
jgi:hypothetical protein